MVVQARVGSSRLPGKVLKQLGDRTALEQVLGRCLQIAGIDVVVCAIPYHSRDDMLVELALTSGALVVRGSETDVLSRHVAAAKAVDAKVVLRVTSDCPLIDPKLCAEVLRLRAAKSADYACNNVPPSFPHGVDCEAFTTESLIKADQNACSAEDREHVTSWLRRSANVKRVVLHGPAGRVLQHRWTLDYREDYIFLHAVFAMLPSLPIIPTWTDVVDLLERSPEIMNLNRQHRRPPN